MSTSDCDAENNRGVDESSHNPQDGSDEEDCSNLKPAYSVADIMNDLSDEEDIFHEAEEGLSKQPHNNDGDSRFIPYLSF